MSKKIVSALLTITAVTSGGAAWGQTAGGPDAGPATAPTEPLPPPPASAASAPTPPPPAPPPEPVTLVAPPPAEVPPPVSELPEREATIARESWFYRPPLAVSIGHGDQKWQATIYGFVEFDAINDSTRSYVDSIGNSLVARDETYAGRVGRTQFSIRNSRLGFELQSPKIAGIKPSAVLEGDFFGNQPSSTSESAFFDSPGFRLRHAYLKLQSEPLEVLAGQSYYLFGWQNYFFPASLEFLGLPNQTFGRTAQLRLTHTFATPAVNVDVAIAALRPAQRDSAIPDGNAGIRVSFNNWKGISTPGNGGTTAFPLSIGVSGTVREFRVNAFTPPPAQSSNSVTGWGFSVDALVPVIGAKDGYDRGNRLTLTGSFVIGSGIADLIGTGGGAQFPLLRNPALANPPPVYTPNIDNGLVTFDVLGVLHTIDWQAFTAGIQYYLPPSGRVFLALNFTESYSKNMSKLYPQGGTEIELLTRVAKLSRYADANVFWDVTPAVRVGASFQYTTTEYIDGETPRNFRYMAQGLYFF
jgi:hypothetical protein